MSLTNGTHRSAENGAKRQLLPYLLLVWWGGAAVQSAKFHLGEIGLCALLLGEGISSAGVQLRQLQPGGIEHAHQN